MLAYAIRLYESKKTLSIDAFTEFEMVSSLLHPLHIFTVGLGGGFLIPLLYRLGKIWVATAFILSLVAMTLISGFCLHSLLYGGHRSTY